ncbi:heterokaryon incompatibility protein-domain-containing protein [Apodospora peruviana]|uniref:Heterokaryon incompatibility protein-domain-containing protein n=1 Tax=Apodospora peruviana TaxID=516989 RepID=A0AAE0HU47_9PEZI|nr:heterokaryon incompatibility protein-domain-containing protein [Apodospora peruviana]
MTTRIHHPNGLYLTVWPVTPFLPVPLATGSIRLLDLDAQQAPGAGQSTKLTGHLRVVRLHDTPSFFCLSYVWGSKSSPNSHTLHCRSQGCDLQITTNCYHALRQIQSRFGISTIWVDSICINQEDSDEKAGQIPLMQDIYSRAASVFIWLGEGNDRSDRAMAYLRHRARFGRRLPLALFAATDDGQREVERRKFRRRTWQDFIYRMREYEPSAEGIDLDEILDREWTHRSWTFQELILARNPVIVCGDQTIHWEDFVTAIYRSLTDKAKIETKELPASATVLTHWRSIIDIWLGFPRNSKPFRRSPEPKPAEDSTSLPRPALSFKDHIVAHWRIEGDVPTSIQFLYWFTVTLLASSAVTTLGYATYETLLSLWNEITIRQHLSSDNVIVTISWYIAALGWAMTAFLSCYCLFRFSRAWYYTVHGRRQDWLANRSLWETGVTESARALDGVRAALRERVSSCAHDKSFSLSGVLRAFGVTPSRPDYTATVWETYLNLCRDLFLWQPSALILLLDAGGSQKDHVDHASWIPDWRTPRPAGWLTLRYRLGVAENATPGIGKPSADIEGYRLRLKGQKLWNWYRIVQQEIPLAQVDDSREGYMFSALEALTPGRGPTHHFQIRHGQTMRGAEFNQREYFEGVRLSFWQGPFDFRANKDEYINFRSICTIFDQHHSAMGSPGSDVSPTEEVDVLLASMFRALRKKKDPWGYFLTATQRLVSEERCLFITTSGHVGSGHLNLEADDEICLLAGVPTPMLLRPRQADGGGCTDGDGPGYTVVGASLVHGLMHGEEFKSEQLKDIILS